METLLFFGLVFIVWYAWSRPGLEEGKALTEMTARALDASGYRLTGWGKESKNGKTASIYPRKYEKEFTLEAVPFTSFIELDSPQRNRAVINARVYSGRNCYFNGRGRDSGINKLTELDIETLHIRALQNHRANTPFNTIKPSKLHPK